MVGRGGRMSADTKEVEMDVLETASSANLAADGKYSLREHLDAVNFWLRPMRGGNQGNQDGCLSFLWEAYDNASYKFGAPAFIGRHVPVANVMVVDSNGSMLWKCVTIIIAVLALLEVASFGSDTGKDIRDISASTAAIAQRQADLQQEQVDIQKLQIQVSELQANYSRQQVQNTEILAAQQNQAVTVATAIVQLTSITNILLTSQQDVLNSTRNSVQALVHVATAIQDNGVTLNNISAESVQLNGGVRNLLKELASLTSESLSTSNAIRTNGDKLNNISAESVQLNEGVRNLLKELTNLTSESLSTSNAIRANGDKLNNISAESVRLNGGVRDLLLEVAALTNESLNTSGGIRANGDKLNNISAESVQLNGRIQELLALSLNNSVQAREEAAIVWKLGYIDSFLHPRPEFYNTSIVSVALSSDDHFCMVRDPVAKVQVAMSPSIQGTVVSVSNETYNAVGQGSYAVGYDVADVTYQLFCAAGTCARAQVSAYPASGTLNSDAFYLCLPLK